MDAGYHRRGPHTGFFSCQCQEETVASAERSRDQGGRPHDAAKKGCYQYANLGSGCANMRLATSTFGYLMNCCAAGQESFYALRGL
jgi:hypothetical protein